MTDLICMGDFPIFGSGLPVSVDIETTGLDWESNMLGTGVAWRYQGKVHSCYLMDPSGVPQRDMFVSGKPVDSNLLVDICQHNQIIMHNHSFDFRLLFKYYGVKPIKNMVDTMQVSRVTAAQDALSLKYLHNKYCSKTTSISKSDLAGQEVMKSKRNSLRNLPLEVVSKYGRNDAIMQLELYEALKEQDRYYREFHSWDARFSELVMKMVTRGLPVYQPNLEHLIKSYKERLLYLESRLADKGLRNANSPAQVAGWLRSAGVDVTSTGEDELEQISSGNYVRIDATAEHREPIMAETCSEILQVRQLGKALTSWLNLILQDSKWDGNVHSQLAPFGTASFRMSSKRISVHGLPFENRGKAYGSDVSQVFGLEDPEMVMAGFDISQAEVRLAAVLSGDHALMEAVSAGHDPYKGLAQQMWGSVERRQDAKSAMLASIYEIGSNTFAETNHKTKEEAEEILGLFRGRFRTLRAESKRQEKLANQNGYVPLCTGRPRWFKPSEADSLYKAFNQRVQGSLAEVMREVMLQFEDMLPGAQVLQIHDAFVSVQHKDTVESTRVALEDALSKVILQKVENQERFNSVVKFPVESKIMSYKEKFA